MKMRTAKRLAGARYHITYILTVCSLHFSFSVLQDDSVTAVTLGTRESLLGKLSSIDWSADELHINGMHKSIAAIQRTLPNFLFFSFLASPIYCDVVSTQKCNKSDSYHSGKGTSNRKFDCLLLIVKYRRNKQKHTQTHSISIFSWVQRRL
jgi:hypothetical protein